VRLGSKRTLAVTAAVLAAAVGGGAAVAAAQDEEGRPSGFLEAVARHLGISSEKLEDAVKAASLEQVDAALEEGKITEEQADELRERIESGEAGPLFGPGAFGFHGPGHGFGHGLGDKLSATADYLGLSVEELRERLTDGRSLADIAEAEGKSVDGLEQAILAEARADLDEAVEAGRLTREHADEILQRLREHVDELVAGDFFERRGRPRFEGPPSDGARAFLPFAL
jgi:hypothetical protein